MAALVDKLTQDAKGIPAVQQLAPRRQKPGTLDLTASTLFIGDLEKHAVICARARELKHFLSYRSANINLGVALEMFFRTLHALHNFWRQKTLLTSEDLKHSGLGWSSCLTQYLIGVPQKS